MNECALALVTRRAKRIVSVQHVWSSVASVAAQYFLHMIS